MREKARRAKRQPKEQTPRTGQSGEAFFCERVEISQRWLIEQGGLRSSPHAPRPGRLAPAPVNSQGINCGQTTLTRSGSRGQYDLFRWPRVAGQGGAVQGAQRLIEPSFSRTRYCRHTRVCQQIDLLTLASVYIRIIYMSMRSMKIMPGSPVFQAISTTFLKTSLALSFS